MVVLGVLSVSWGLGWCEATESIPNWRVDRVGRHNTTRRQARTCRTWCNTERRCVVVLRLWSTGHWGWTELTEVFRWGWIGAPLNFQPLLPVSDGWQSPPSVGGSRC